MKKLIYLLTMLAILLQACGPATQQKSNDNKKISDQSGSIIINGSDVLYPLAVKWETEFNKQYPKVVIENKATCTDNSLRLLKAGAIQLAMVSRPLTSDEEAAGLFAIPVAIDAVLPVISFENDNIQTIVQKGVSPKKLAAVFEGRIKTWGQLLGNASKVEIETFILPDSTGTSHIWAGLLQTNAKKLKGTCLVDNAAVVRTIDTKKFGIGYCSMSRIYDSKTNMRRGNIYVLPIDLNSNGQADDNELVMDKLDGLKSAISQGKYPMPPARMLYLVTKNKANNAPLKTFIIWVLGIGQNFCAEAGLLNIDKQTADKYAGEIR